MPFGRSAQPAKQRTDDSNNAVNIFLPLTAGTRTIRVSPGAEEIRVKRHWLAQDTDGTWVPAPGYNPKDTRVKKPIIVAVFNPDKGVFVGENAKWRDNPIDAWIAANNLDKAYAQERFYLSVIDRTFVRKDSTGKVYWPNMANEYPSESELQPKVAHNAPMVLEGSSGDPDGKSLYAALVRLLKTTVGSDGELLPIYDFDIKIVTSGTGEKTQRDVRDDARSVGALPATLAELPQYDLVSWLKPWPADAITALMSGSDYNEVIEHYGIVQMPKLIPTVTDGAFE